MGQWVTGKCLPVHECHLNKEASPLLKLLNAKHICAHTPTPRPAEVFVCSLPFKWHSNLKCSSSVLQVVNWKSSSDTQLQCVLSRNLFLRPLMALSPPYLYLTMTSADPRTGSSRAVPDPVCPELRIWGERRWVSVFWKSMATWDPHDSGSEQRFGAHTPEFSNSGEFT